VATEVEAREDGAPPCTVRTVWLPRGEVERVEPARMDGVELRMEALAELADSAAARKALTPLVDGYREWIERQARGLPGEARRRETAEELIRRCETAADRIEAGVELLVEPLVFEAFRFANRAMAMAARRRNAQIAAK